MLIVIITEALLYISFSLLVGGLLAYVVPSSKWPELSIPKRLIRICPLAIAVLSFGPLFPLIVGYTDDIGLWQSVSKVLFTFSLGWTWMFTFMLSVLLFCLLQYNRFEKNRALAIIGLVIVILLAAALGKSGHAASLSGIKGFISHSLHFIAVIFWIGPLLLVGWFTKSSANWQGFTKWFTPLALICVATVIVSGLITMQIDIKTYTAEEPSTASQYVDSWMVNYGQALLIKHLLILPLLAFAIINSFIIRRKVNENDHYNPVQWVRTEAIVAILIFSATAYMGQQEPPHLIPGIIKVLGPSPLFDVIYQGTIVPEMNLALHFGSVSYVLFLFAIISLFLMILTAVKKASPVVGFTLALVTVISAYLGLMLGVNGLY